MDGHLRIWLLSDSDKSQDRETGSCSASEATPQRCFRLWKIGALIATWAGWYMVTWHSMYRPTTGIEAGSECARMVYNPPRRHGRIASPLPDAKKLQIGKIWHYTNFAIQSRNLSSTGISGKHENWKKRGKLGGNRENPRGQVRGKNEGCARNWGLRKFMMQADDHEAQNLQKNAQDNSTRATIKILRCEEGNMIECEKIFDPKKIILTVSLDQEMHLMCNLG